MDINRRSLMKGLLAGGALLTLGSPSWAFADHPARRPKRVVLFLENTGADDAFANGCRVACAEAASLDLRTVEVTGGILLNPDGLAALLDETRGARWIVVIDEAGAVVFQELARAAGGRLLSVGSHLVSEGNACPLRHVWLSVSPAQGIGGLLAAQLAGTHHSWSITERFLSDSSTTRTLTGWSAPGFASHRLDGPDTTHLHCSGLSRLEGCDLLGLTPSEGWTAIPPAVCRREAISRPSANWVESVGRAVTASALGVDQVRESCSCRAFVLRSGSGGPIQPTDRFVSFVMDV